MGIVTLYSGASGLNTVLDPQRLSQGGKDDQGTIELAQAVNVWIDDRGLVTLRTGDTLVQAGEFHSLFCDGGDCFVVQDGAVSGTLHRVLVSEAGVVSLSAPIRLDMIRGARLSYAQVGHLTFYTNGTQHGIITGGVDGVWGVDTYQGPEEISFLSSVPVGNHLGYDGAGTLAVAKGSVVLFNYLLFSFGLFSEAKGWVQLASNVRMVRFVETGWFISDQQRTYFFRGFNWNTFIESVVVEYPAHEWSCANARILAADVGLDMQGHCSVWSSPRGICLGTPNGTVINLTESRVDYPRAYERAACLIYDNKKIFHTVY